MCKFPNLTCRALRLTFSTFPPRDSFTYCWVLAAKGVKEALRKVLISLLKYWGALRLHHHKGGGGRGAYVKFFPNAETLSMADELEIKISWNGSRRFSAISFENAKC
jgi:hypothetical protein